MVYHYVYVSLVFEDLKTYNEHEDVILLTILDVKQVEGFASLINRDGHVVNSYLDISVSINNCNTTTLNLILHYFHQRIPFQVNPYKYYNGRIPSHHPNLVLLFLLHLM